MDLRDLEGIGDGLRSIIDRNPKIRLRVEELRLQKMVKDIKPYEYMDNEIVEEYLSDLKAMLDQVELVNNLHKQVKELP
jgi:hypothetical protein